MYKINWQQTGKESKTKCIDEMGEKGDVIWWSDDV
jgi:hypothetical protein